MGLFDGYAENTVWGRGRDQRGEVGFGVVAAHLLVGVDWVVRR